MGNNSNGKWTWKSGFEQYGRALERMFESQEGVAPWMQGMMPALAMMETLQSEMLKAAQINFTAQSEALRRAADALSGPPTTTILAMFEAMIQKPRLWTSSLTEPSASMQPQDLFSRNVQAWHEAAERIIEDTNSISNAGVQALQQMFSYPEPKTRSASTRAA